MDKGSREESRLDLTSEALCFEIVSAVGAFCELLTLIPHIVSRISLDFFCLYSSGFAEAFCRFFVE